MVAPSFQFQESRTWFPETLVVEPLGSLRVRVKGTYGVHGPVTTPVGSFGNSARTRQRQMPGPKR